MTTLQVIAFLDALLYHKETGLKRMLVIEFQRWLDDENDYRVSVCACGCVATWYEPTCMYICASASVFSTDIILLYVPSGICYRKLQCFRSVFRCILHEGIRVQRGILANLCCSACRWKNSLCMVTTHPTPPFSPLLFSDYQL